MLRGTGPRVIAAIGVSVALVLGANVSAGAATVPGRHQPSAAPAAAQKYFWKWSDGSQKTSRLFRQKTWKTQEKMPHLVVTAVPATPAKVVYLQFKQKGKWVVENKVTTDAKGVATISLNPFCSNDTWCDGTWSYRLKIGSLYQNLKIAYSEK
ncbi:MAG: hypothetical protein WCP95_04840 [Actinomycetes bacterium]